jgi:signal transduction histidine kinase
VPYQYSPIHRHSGSKIAAIHLARAGGEISLKVEDTGKGIPAEKLEGTQKERSGVGIYGDARASAISRA